MCLDIEKTCNSQRAAIQTVLQIPSVAVSCQESTSLLILNCLWSSATCPGFCFLWFVVWFWNSWLVKMWWYKLMWCLGGKLAKYAWKTPSILNISSHQDSGWWFITLLVARPTKSVIYFVLAFQYQVLFMVSINAHAVSLSLHLVSDAFFFFFCLPHRTQSLYFVILPWYAFGDIHFHEESI